MINNEMKENLRESFLKITNNVYVNCNLDNSRASSVFKEILDTLVELTDKIVVSHNKLQEPSTCLISNNIEYYPIKFSATPEGHEFTSFILAILYMGGVGPKIDQEVKEQISNIKKRCRFEIYMNASCTNCPDVVQSLITMATINSNISVNIIDINLFTEESKAKDITGIPTVYLNDELFHIGKISLLALLNEFNKKFKIISSNKEDILTSSDEVYDVLVIGGGPAGASSAIYAARKGVKTCLVAYEFGGQILETLGIENVIGTKYIEGIQLKDKLKEHVSDYDIKCMLGNYVTSVAKDKSTNLFTINLDNDKKLKSKTLIIATGAKWKKINIPGEDEFKSRGISYCTHCDGPLFKNKDVIIIGGGNSGIEAALDIAGIARKVTVLEYMDKLKADFVLREKIKNYPNIQVITSAQITHINGTETVESITYIDRNTKTTHNVEAQGVFPLIGLRPNTHFLHDFISLDNYGQIIVDKHHCTNIEGVFAAGDCTDNIYKQIVISMGQGAIAALSANDYLILNSLIDVK